MMMMITNQTYSYSPNPASSELSIDLIDETSPELVEASKKKDKKSYEAFLLNDKGQKIRVGKNNQDYKVKFDVCDVPNGTYFLHIQEGKELLKSQVIIQH